MAPRQTRGAYLFYLLQAKGFIPIMLTMRWLSMGGRLNQKKVIYIAVAVVVLAVVAGLLLHSSNKNSKKTAHNNNGPSNAQIASTDSNNAQKAIADKDYTTAVNNYIEAINAAEASGNIDRAASLIKDAINNIPDSQVPWIIWDDQVGVAKAQKNKTLEISSIKKAIIKAQQPNSGAPAGIVTVYQKMLKQLGAS